MTSYARMGGGSMTTIDVVRAALELLRETRSGRYVDAALAALEEMRKDTERLERQGKLHHEWSDYAGSDAGQKEYAKSEILQTRPQPGPISTLAVVRGKQADLCKAAPAKANH